MLEQIRIKDFAVARDLTISLGPGLTVFTGETGAGKSIVVDALAFAFGARKGREVLAAGADRAEITLAATDGEHRIEIERTIGRAGRAAARMGGAAATVDDLVLAGDRLIDIHGQSEQLSILRPAQQLAVLDSFAGITDRVAAFAAAVRELRSVRRQARTLAADMRERERLTGQLRYELEEIESANPEPGEDERLRADQQRLAHAGRLIEAAEVALTALDGGEIGQLLAALDEITSRDQSVSDLSDAAIAFQAAADDLRRSLRGYRDGLELDPERLSELEQRLDLLARLRRKYGDTIDDVIAYADAARERLATLEGSEVTLESLAARERELVAELTPLAIELSEKRRRAAGELVGRVAAELAELGMPAARLAVGFEAAHDADGLSLALPDYEVIESAWEPGEPHEEPATIAFSESGVDRVEFLVTFNAGGSLKPLAAVASGGETSRFLLALTTVLGSAAPPKTIVFDEVDEGVGGRAGALVGRALARLAERHQVLCITHLPQVAAYGDRHFVVSKQSDGAKTWSEVVPIDGEARVSELASMFGSVTDATRDAAKELLEAAKRARA